MTAATCAALLVVFYVLGFLAYQPHSATIDEPLHAAGAYLHVIEHDYRINPEDPPLWNYLAIIPHLRYRFPPDPDVETWRKQADNVMYQFMVTTRRLFQTPGVDGAAFINRSRAMMLLAGVGLGAAIAAWTGQLAGSGATFASIVACALFAMDPNFLGHAALLKNDVCLSLNLFCLAWATWSLVKRARWWNVTLASLLCAIGPLVKFSGLLLGVIFATTLLARALGSLPWNWFGRELRSRTARLGSAIALCIATGLLSYVLIWACYGFRFEPTPTPGLMLNMSTEIDGLKQNVHYLRTGKWASESQQAAMRIPTVGRAVLFAERHRLFPQAWLFGFLFTYKSTLVRETFLLGSYSNTGWWYYFPLDMLFKTPLATIVALLLAAAFTVARRRNQNGAARLDRWSFLCLFIPIAIYGISALTTNLNLGLRHVLPIYPFLFAAAGVAAARARDAMPPRPFKAITIVLAAGLAAESLLAFPHYISFFNAPSRPYRLSLVSDSNFDWGQDLPYVAAWQHDHPDEKLYLGYWGTVDPAFYNIRYQNIPGGFVLNPDYEWPPRQRGVIAISATLLQGVNCPPSCRLFYGPLRELEPREILGDTIYLFDWPIR